MPSAIVHLSSVAGSPLLDSDGGRLGRVEDVIARLDLGDERPPLVGLKARIGGREMFVPIGRISQLGPEAARTSTTKLNLAQFESRPGEVLLRRDLLDHSLINVASARLVNAREVELERAGGKWQVAGIDTALRLRLRRLAPKSMRRADTDNTQSQFVPWEELEPFVGHVPTSRLKLTSRRLARLHPAQIADLVEAASHEEGEEILAAVGQDKDLEADVFEELDDEHQVEFLRERSDEEVAAVLARMDSDDAADLLLEIPQERRIPVLNLLPTPKQIKIKTLLSHNPNTAGGLMNPDFVTVDVEGTVEQALATVRASELDREQVTTACAVDPTGRYAGLVLLYDLISGDPAAGVAALVYSQAPTVTTEEELPEVARLMTDYDLLALAVLDVDSRPVGLIGVDDVLALLLPEEWRRRSGVARG